MSFARSVANAAGVFAGLLFAGTAAAAPITADFHGSFDLPEIGVGPRVIENLGEAVDGAPDADLSHEISNPSSWDGALSIDLDASGLITLTGIEEENVFDLVEITISNIVFDAAQAITGIVELTNNAVRHDETLTAVTPTFSFGDTWIKIVFDTTGVGDAADLRLLFGETATYQLSFGSPSEVPLPAAFPLFFAGLAGFGAAAKRARRAAKA